MLYLLDANTLIDANRDYYGIGQVDEYWEWLVYQGEIGNVQIPLEIYEEIKAGSDDLTDWAKDTDTEDALRLDEEVDIDLVRKVIEEGYGPNLTDIQIDKLGRDPFLIAYALKDSTNRIVVTTEQSKPSKQGANRHVPDVCAQFGIQTYNAFQFGRALGFRTDWKSLI